MHAAFFRAYRRTVITSFINACMFWIQELTYGTVGTCQQLEPKIHEKSILTLGSAFIYLGWPHLQIYLFNCCIRLFRHSFKALLLQNKTDIINHPTEGCAQQQASLG